MNKKYKKIILIDLDGVLNEYRGNFDKNYIPPIKEGAREFLRELNSEYEFKLFTTRDTKLATKWVKENELENYISEITNYKEPSYLIIDDRCITFNGNYNTLYNSIKNFNVWYKI